MTGQMSVVRDRLFDHRSLTNYNLRFIEDVNLLFVCRDAAGELHGSTNVAIPKFDGDQPETNPSPQLIDAALPLPSLSLSSNERPILLPKAGLMPPSSDQGIFNS